MRWSPTWILIAISTASLGVTACKAAEDETSSADSGTLAPPDNQMIDDLCGDLAAEDPLYELCSDPVLVTAFEEYRATFEEYLQEIDPDEYQPTRCAPVATATLAPPPVAGTYEIAQCDYYISSDDSHGHPCYAAFTLSGQHEIDAITHGISWENLSALTPGTSAALVRGQAGQIGVWFRTTDTIEPSGCSVSSINVVVISPPTAFSCGFSARFEDSCSLPAWSVWSGEYELAELP